MMDEEEQIPCIEPPTIVRPNPKVEGQQRVGWVIVAQLCTELMVAGFTLGPAYDNRASFHYESAEISTMIICTVLWAALYVFRKHYILSWVFLVLWTIDFGLTIAFVSVSIQSALPIFFVGFCAVNAICLMIGLTLHIATKWLPFIHSPLTIGGFVLLFCLDTKLARDKWIAVPLMVISFALNSWVTYTVVQAKHNGYSIVGFRDSLNHLYTAPIKKIVMVYRSSSSN